MIDVSFFVPDWNDWKSQGYTNRFVPTIYMYRRGLPPFQNKMTIIWYPFNGKILAFCQNVITNHFL